MSQLASSMPKNTVNIKYDHLGGREMAAKEVVVPILRVSRSNTDGSVIAGDRVCYTPDGSLNLLHPQYGGWMSKDELKDAITDFEYEVDTEYERVITARRHYTRKKC